MSNRYKLANCHPGRLHAAKGLCAQCYAAQYNAANREARLAKMRAYNHAVRDNLSLRRPAPCHLDRPHYARGLCEQCYHRSEHARALRKARYAARPRDTAAAAPEKVAPRATIGVEVFGRTVGGVTAVRMAESPSGRVQPGGVLVTSALSFFRRPK